jgi:hypothetical protein
MKTKNTKKITYIPEVGDKVYFYAGGVGARIDWAEITGIEGNEVHIRYRIGGELGKDSLHNETILKWLVWNKERQMWFDKGYTNFEGWWPSVDTWVDSMARVK